MLFIIIFCIFTFIKLINLKNNFIERETKGFRYFGVMRYSWGKVRKI